MSKEGGNFFENHVEKVVLAAVGLVCIWLMATRVLVSPNIVEYGGQRLSPSKIDESIRRQAENWEQKLNRKPEPKQPYEQRFAGFAALVEGNTSDANSYVDFYPLIAEKFAQCADYAIGNIDISVAFDLPYDSEVIEDREYRLPLIGRVDEVSLEHFRAVAYLPTFPVDEQNGYDEAGSEPNDLDFVTVQAKFDVAKLYESFYDCFMGEDVPEEWRDPCLARPVFAAVNLQRQQMLSDGCWSDWEDVPRARIDARRNVFGVEKIEKMPPGGIKFRLFQFGQWEVIRDLLQPQAYVIASAEEEWFPPELHEKYLDIQRKIEVEERREAKEAERKEKEHRRAEVLRRPGLYGDRRGPYEDAEERQFTQRSGRSGEPLTRRRGGREYNRPLLSSPRTRDVPKRGELRSAKSKRPSKTTYKNAIDDLYDELQKILITKKTDVSRMSEPLVFWAHDDTVEPGNSYRYRIQLGVFNPVAGTDQVSEQYGSLKNTVVLWSGFSKETEPVEIPATLYFFPMREAAKVVTVKVSRYLLGYWYGRNFAVQQGEVIGRVVENKQTEDETVGTKGRLMVPEVIDYGTGAALVDVTTVNGWLGGNGKNLHSRVCPDMLYSFDGTSIEHIPVALKNWCRELQMKFREIEKLESRQKKPLRSWKSKLSYQRTTARRRTEEGPKEYTPEDEEESEMEAWRKMMEKIGGAR